MWVLHSGAYGWESHVVTEGVAEHWAYQVSWNGIQVQVDTLKVGRNVCNCEGSHLF